MDAKTIITILVTCIFSIIGTLATTYMQKTDDAAMQAPLVTKELGDTNEELDRRGIWMNQTDDIAKDNRKDIGHMKGNIADIKGDIKEIEKKTDQIPSILSKLETIESMFALIIQHSKAQPAHYVQRQSSFKE